MNLVDFGQQLNEMQERVTQLQQLSEEPASQQQQQEIMVATFQEISISLEELLVANEELHSSYQIIEQQNQELSATNQALVTERQRYQDLFETAPDAYLVTNPDGVIQEANRAAAKLLNRSQQFLIGIPLFVYVAAEEQQTFCSQLRELHQLERVQEWELCLQSPDKMLITVAVTVTVVRNREGTLVSLRWLLRDITQRVQAEAEVRKALEKEQELSLLKSGFINTTSHEFRTPLTTISLSAGLLETYAAKWAEAKKQTHWQRINTAVQHMTQMLYDLLLMAHAESDKLEFNPKPLALEPFCQELIAQMQLIAGDRHTLTFVSQGECLDTGMEGLPLLDDKLLRHILTNLLSNAIKYSPLGGPIQLELTGKCQQVIFQIQDRGIGIPQLDQKHLFETFYRATNVGTIAGTGLGLAIIKKFVNLHSGKIQIESQEGAGTTVTVKLPILNIDGEKI